MPTPPDTDTIREKLAALLPGLQARYGVRALSIFGSYARGEQTAESDLDVLVDFEKMPDLYTFGNLALDLEEALELDVDVCTRSMLKPRIAPRILRDLVAV